MHILTDVGGTKTRIARSRDLEKFDEPIVYKTPQNYNDAIPKLNEEIKKIAGEESIDNIVVGLPGLLDSENTKLLRAPHLNDWVEKPLKSDLSELSKNIILENDTALVGLGEAVSGAGKNSNLMAYITVSTGVGGVKIENKKIDKTSLGFEPGHHYIDRDGEKLYTLENLISGKGIQSRFGVNPREVHDDRIWKEAEEILAIGLSNVCAFWSPDLIVVGGGMIIYEHLWVDRVVEHFKKVYKISPEPPEIKKAELGDFGGIYGGMELLRLR